MLNIKHVYCSHLLINKSLKESINNDENDIFFIKPHHIIPIKKSIHFNSLVNNNYELYNELIIKTKQKEHSLQNFKNLIENFDIKKMNKIKIQYNNIIDKYVIQDGLHRISILLFKKIIDDNIPLEYLDISFEDDIIENIKEKLNNTTIKNFYNGWNNRTKYGYHSFSIYNIEILGQRQPILRLNEIKKHIDFRNKIVLDFGCNTGGMLLHLKEIKKGYGFDYSEKCIESANYIKDKLKYIDVNFFKSDLNKFDFDEFLYKNNLKKNIDIIFLLSLGSWIKEWRKLYKKSFENSKNIILETNNDREGKEQLNLFRSLNANIKLIINNSLDDTTKNNRRKTYLITKKKVD